MTGLKIIVAVFIGLFSCATLFAQSANTPSELYKKGLALYDKQGLKAYPIFVQAMQLAAKQNDWETYIEALNRSSSLAIEEKGNLEYSFKASKEALAKIEVFKSRAAVAELHYNIGEFYNLKYDIDTALNFYNKSKEMFFMLGGELTQDVAKCYHGIGDVNKYNALDFYEAEINYEKALRIRERIGFKDTLVLYRNFYSLAATNRSQRDFEKGLSYGEKALELSRTLDPERYELTTAMVANIYRDMKESAMAKKYYLEALTLNKKTNKKDSRAWYYLCLGEAYKNDSLYQDALNCYSQAYPFYKSSQSTEGNLFLYLLLESSYVYSKVQDDKRFFKTIQELFTTLSQRNEVRGHFMCQGLSRVGDFYYDRKNYDSALHYYQKSLVALVPSFKSLKIDDNPTLEAIGFFDFAYVVLAKKASALKDKFKTSQNSKYLAQSLNCLRLAEQLLAKQRGNLDMDKSKWQFLDSEYDLYEDILVHLFDGKTMFAEDTLYNLAFRYFENSKSRSLADALAEAEQTKRITSKDSLFQVHVELRRKLLAVQDKINYELEKSTASEAIPPLREEMVSIDRKIQYCKQAIEEKYPGYFNVKYGNATHSLKDLRRILKDRGQVTLEYFWGSKWVYALYVSPEEIRFERIGRPDSLSATIAMLIKHFDEKTSAINIDVYNSFVENAHELYKVLVQPFASLIKDRQRILVIPDGAVNQVPFEILLSDRPSGAAVDYRSLKYLIRDHSIGYAYSSVMVMRQFDKPVRKPSLLAVGFTGGSRLRAPDPELEEIIGAEEELDALQKRFKQGKFLVGPDATEANFKSLSSQYDLIHLAIHGRGDIQKSFSSSLYFRSKYDSLDDGELHDYELYGLKLKATMAVLSACESGLGRGYKGEGMISMASAFTYSGCENILMSLWKVNDKASIKLMDDFYGQLIEGRTIDDALRQAKLDFLEGSDELTADPKIWAPLVAYGGLEPVFKKSDNIVVYSVIGLLALVSILFAFRKRTTI